jgi:hypothetical protein
LQACQNGFIRNTQQDGEMPARNSTKLDSNSVVPVKMAIQVCSDRRGKINFNALPPGNGGGGVSANKK